MQEFLCPLRTDRWLRSRLSLEFSNCYYKFDTLYVTIVTIIMAIVLNSLVIARLISSTT